MYRARGALSRQTVLAYVLAPAAVAAAAVVTALVWPEPGTRVPIFFIMGVAVAAWHGGLVPGLIATVLGGMAYAGLVPPLMSLEIGDPLRSQLLVVFGLLGVMLSTLSGLRIRSEQRYKAEHERLRVTLSSIGDAIISTDERGRVTYLNPVAEALTGWTGAEAAGQPLDEVFHIVNEESRKPVDNPVAEVLRTGRIVGLANHTVLVGRGGREVPIDDSAAPIVDEAGRVVGVILVFRDVTDAKKVERGIRQSEAWFRGVAEQTPVMVWMSDVHNTPRWFNRRWVEFVGKPVEALVGSGFTSYIHPEDLEKIFKVSNGAYAAREPFEVEFRLRRHDGQYRWVVGNGAPTYDGEGVFLGYCGTTIDITERKEMADSREKVLAAERQAREAAEAASRSKDEFLAMLSHELRTPLTPVLATIRSMEREHELPEAVRADLATVRRNVELEARLIDDLLDLTRVARNKVQLNMEPVDVHAAVRSALDIVGGDIRARRQEVELRLEAGRRFVRGDAARLQQIFWNLLNNASKFTEHGGRLTVRTRDGAGGCVQVDVADTGIGIDAAVLPRVFDAFEQGNRGVTRVFGGLGLGLAITKALVEMHGGRVSAASGGKGQGATFTVELPAVADAPAARAAPAAAPAGATGLRVLLVEDHPDSARTLARVITSMSHAVTVANSVATGLEAALGGEFDVLISDIGLPDGTGVDLLRHIYLKKRLPAIALTGYGMEEDVRRCLEAGFVMHLTKPVNLDKLEVAIAAAAG